MLGITFKRTNGNVPRSLPGEDHISGYVAYMSALPSGFAADKRIQAVSSIETAEALGITADAAAWETKVLHYQLSQIFRINPGISLYVGLFAKPAGNNYTFAEIKAMQNFAAGRIRQVGVYAGDKLLAAADLTALQGMATELEAEDAPLSILYAPKISSPSTLENLSGVGQKNVSVVIAQDGAGTAAGLFINEANANTSAVTALGIALGTLSLAAVNESIAWVGKFPTGVAVPAFSDGTLLGSLDKAIVEMLDSYRYLFLRTYSGYSGSFWNDSHTMDVATSDYAMIEKVRTMDKAVRGIMASLIPELGGTLYIDAPTGKLQTYTVKHLEKVAGRALEDMEKAGELSGMSVSIDPDQEVARTSTIEFVIKEVATEVFRKGIINIGFAGSV